MFSQEFYLDTSNFDDVYLARVSTLGAKRFTRPAEMSEDEFRQRIRQEIEDGKIDIIVRETILERKFV